MAEQFGDHDRIMDALREKKKAADRMGRSTAEEQGANWTAAARTAVTNLNPTTQVDGLLFSLLQIGGYINLANNTDMLNRINVVSDLTFLRLLRMTYSARFPVHRNC